VVTVSIMPAFAAFAGAALAAAASACIKGDSAKRGSDAKRTIAGARAPSVAGRLAAGENAAAAPNETTTKKRVGIKISVRRDRAK
jgi:hypothetical protein